MGKPTIEQIISKAFDDVKNRYSPDVNAIFMSKKRKSSLKKDFYLHPIIYHNEHFDSNSFFIFEADIKILRTKDKTNRLDFEHFDIVPVQDGFFKGF